MRRACTAAFGLLLLAGCVNPPPAPAPSAPVSSIPAPEATPQPEAVPEPAPEPQVATARVEPPRARPDDIERLLSYFEQVRKLPTADLGREGESARAAFSRTRSDFDRVRLAMVLAVPNTPLTDDQRAAELLEPLVKNSASTLHGLALLMSAHLQERRRLESGMQNLQQNVQGLQQKLDALMSLERSLIDREPVNPPTRKR